MTSYPKSREELQIDIDAMSARVVALTADNESLRAALNRSEIEIAYLRRRRGAHQLDPAATDAFRRPLRRRK